ncbi:D-amino acid dehydrogenase small subunit [Posidoniimonas polymericola]|uniref:D-amino acid dehydrogenase small subunit n=1 Tax=Posidoniimonas polymericola TaxID=2528002 RepID=A0A5C5YMP7_9BACT|nr:TIGR03364 family FAD-dependent oxidoreductase [Posidoniimonas polymericola]TWT76048.1 D-amino acid dehydrogenase small subunit [Posidoniimonas polymericola]
MAEKIAVIGGGIVGIANAWQFAKTGASVTLFERNPVACGASVRNFGMVWPIGQPKGPLHATALRSRELWDEALVGARAWSNPCGSIHVATRDDEFEVLAEFAQKSSQLGYECELLTPEKAAAASPALRAQDLVGALWSPTEMCVDPRQVIRQAPGWLRDRYCVELQYGVTVREVLPTGLVDDRGRVWEFDQVIVASGVDLKSLFPEVHANAGLGACKLQMMRTVPQPEGWRIGPMLASGLTLRHYLAFGICDSLESLKRRVAEETPELDAYGIHVMASQNGDGNVVLGDSHEHNQEIEPFDKSAIDDLMMRELRRFLHLPDWSVEQRWHGVYSTLPGEVQFVYRPYERVTIVVATGGAGMTMSFGLAERLASGDRTLSGVPALT